MGSGKQRMADHAYKHRINETALFQSGQTRSKSDNDSTFQFSLC